MKNKLLLILCSILYLIQVVIIFILWQNLGSKKNEKIELLKKYEAVCFQNNQYKRNSLMSEKYSGQFLDVKIIFSNRNGNEMELTKILNDSVNFIFYIPPITCSSCNINIYNNLPNVINTLGSKLKIIGSMSDMNSIVLFSNNNTTDNNLFYLIDNNSFSLIKISQPYLLKINNYGQILSIFIVNDNDVNLFNEVIENEVN